MTSSDFISDWHPDGYLSFTGTLPPGPSPEEIDHIFFELDSAVQAVNEPPIAYIASTAGSLICRDFDIIKQDRADNYDDQRGFLVEFSSTPTLEQMRSVLNIVFDTFNEIKNSYPDAGLTK